MITNIRLRIEVLVLAFLIGVGASTTQAMVQDAITRHLTVAPGGRLVMNVDRGSIEVKTVDGNEALVRAYRKVNKFWKKSGDEVLQRHHVEITQVGNDIHVDATFDRPHWTWHRSNDDLTVRYEISIPKKYHLELKTGGGWIVIEDLEGKVNASTSGGGLTFTRIKGPILGRTSGGSVVVKECSDSVDVETSGGGLTIGQVEGNVSAKTSGGSIVVANTRGDLFARTSGGGIDISESAGKVDAATTGGSIVARLSKQPSGDCRLETSGGNVEVRLAGDIKVDLDASTMGGRVSSDFEVPVRGELKSNSLQTKINGGGPLLSARTLGGNVHIRKL
jgi:hypothetical protein